MAEKEKRKRKSNHGWKRRLGRYFHSLKFELMVLFVGIVILVCVLIMLANRFLLEQYYYDQKEKALESTYELLNEAAEEGTINSITFGTQITQIGNRDNINILVMDEESQTVRSFTTDTDTMMRRMWDNIVENTDELPENFNEEDTQAWMNDKNAPNYYIVKMIQDEDTVRVQIVLDKSTNTEYMERWGILSDGSYYLMRTAIDSIRINSEIANQFTLYVAIIVLIVGAIIAILIARGVTKPIEEISNLSQKMGQLDFSAKYVSNHHARNEIETLGENMNDLSRKLEETISELKNANAQLEQDIERRDKTEQMQREFISNVTHELKTPIALIQGYAEGLQDGMAEDPDDRDYYCAVITDEAKKMNHMVQQLLSLTHLEFGQNNDMQYENFNIVEMVQGYIATAGLLTKDQQIHIQLDSIEPVYVWADQFYAEEVFQNYFTNALHYCKVPSAKKGEGKIGKEVSIQGFSWEDKVIRIQFIKKESSVRIVVFNTGDPIPEESLPRLGEKFYKVDKARTREYGGSGVGLSIVKAIMELLHQPYGVTNYDNGVEFWYELETK